jgi:hypothetical protein
MGYNETPTTKETTMYDNRHPIERRIHWNIAVAKGKIKSLNKDQVTFLALLGTTIAAGMANTARRVNA